MILYRRVFLDEMLKNVIRELNLTNPQGEPLMSPHVEECIDFAIQRGFQVQINAYCTTLGERNINTLCRAAATGMLHIQVSYSGYDKDSHEKVYIGSSFEDSSKKLKALNVALTNLGLQRFLTINGIIYDSTLFIHIVFLERLGIARSRVRMGLPDNVAGIVKVVSKNRAKGIFSFKPDLPHRSLRTYHLLAQCLLVYDDGKMFAFVCRDAENVMEIGDINFESLSEIRNGYRFLMMLKAFMDRNIDGMTLCQKCDIPYGYRVHEVLFDGSISSPIPN